MYYAGQRLREPFSGDRDIHFIERGGLITRKSDSSDCRLKRMVITLAGNAAISSSEPARTSYPKKVFAAFDDSEPATLTSLFGKLNERLSALEGLAKTRFVKHLRNNMALQ